MAPAFDIDRFLARPLVCRLATSGPRVLPVWFLWEDGAFWILTGRWSSLPGAIGSDPAVALVVDTCDLRNGETLQVVARGTAELVPFDVARGQRMLSRYLGDDLDRWDRRFVEYLEGGRGLGTVWALIRPDRLVARDLSFRPAESTA